MNNIFSIVITLIVFTVLVTIHEFGHFIMAKKSGIMVKEFAIGMGPAILKKQFGETVYSIRILPLGGYCAMLGEDGGDDPRSFVEKSIIQRFLVLVMGPMMNFLLAFAILIGLVGTSYVTMPNVRSVMENSSSYDAGLKAGDEIIEVNGEKINIYFDLQMALESSGGKPLDVVVLRDGQKVELTIEPKFDEERQAYIMGFYTQVKAGAFAEEQVLSDGTKVENMSIFETLKESFYTMLFYIKSTIVGFIRIITLNVSKDEVMGPVGIVKVVGDSYEAGLEYSTMEAIRNVLSLSALLSANLGAINLFPIPALDGGRILFLAIEALRRKPLDHEKEGFVHFAGFVILMIFMLFVAFNDITRLF